MIWGQCQVFLPSEVYPKVTFSLHNKIALFNDDVYHHDNHPMTRALLETGFRKDKTSYLPRRMACSRPHSTVLTDIVLRNIQLLRGSAGQLCNVPNESFPSAGDDNV